MDNFDYPAIGQRIKQLRKRKGLNQTELAQMLKKSLRTVQKYETGENGVSLRVDPRKGKDTAELSEMLTAWAQQAEKLRSGEINREDYDKWRYNYPKYDETSGYVKVPSQQLSDAMAEAFKERLKND